MKKTMTNSLSMPWPFGRQFRAGVTILELIIVLAILGILSLGVVPFTMIQVQSIKEEELKQNLTIIRQAIRDYRDEAERKYKSLMRDHTYTVLCCNLSSLTTHIPPWQFYPRLTNGVFDLSILVTGTTTFIPASVTTYFTGISRGTRVKPILNKLPVDPFTGQASWVLFYYPTDTKKFGTYVFDVAPSRPRAETWFGAGPTRSLGGTFYADF